MGVNQVLVGDEVKLDLTADTVTEDNLLAGATAHNAAGEPIEGAVVTVPVDSELSETSANAIQNMAVAKAVNALKEDLGANTDMLLAIDHNKTTSIKLNALEVVTNGYLNIDGSIASAISHRIVKLPMKYGIKRVTFNSAQAIPTLVLMICFYKDGKVVPGSAVVGNGSKSQTVNIKDDCPEDGYILINYFDYATDIYYSSLDDILFKKITDYYHDEIEEIYNSLKIPVYTSCVNKPFNFNGKTALFFGDSITQGFTNGTNITPNGYPKLFSNMVGMNFVNNGVGGSCFSYDYNGVQSIIHKVGGTDVSAFNSADYVFVAGGVNDWQTGATLKQVSDSVGTLCQFFRDKNVKNVIFITPINHGGKEPKVTPKAPLQQFRNVITIKALEYGFDVVQGNEIPFPDESGTDYFINLMYGDKFHPTELGYKVYAKGLATILC